MERTTIAALLTCYNRKDKTLACLEALFNQVLPPGMAIAAYLVDDGSTDGTSDAVQRAYPDVKILQGNGNLFWNGGMRQAIEAAIKDDPDYYLWLNDDTLLYLESLNTLLTTYKQLAARGEARSLLTASTCDPQTGDLSYGGMVRHSWWRPLKFHLVKPGETPKPCDTLNGNCVLIPREVAKLVGNLDPAFTHYLGDFDYGLRAKQQGCTVWIAPGYLGTCSYNPREESQTNSSEDLQDIIKKIDRPKGLSVRQEVLYSLDEWKHFAQRHGGAFWPIYWLIPYRRLLLLSVFDKLKGKKS